MTPPLIDALQAIARGDYDANLDRIITAAQERQRNVKREASLNLKPGAVVRINDSISPAYFRNYRATVISVDRDGRKPRALIEFDEADAGYLRMRGAKYIRTGNQINAPLACLDPITT